MIDPRSRAGLALLGAALYGGPVLAGLARHDWSVLPVFATLFLLYVVASRRPDLSSGAGRANLVTLGVVQVALVAIGWAIGGGLANIVGPVVLPLWAPLAITALAAGLGVWAFRDAAEMDVMLESALARLAEMEAVPDEARDVPWPDSDPEIEAAAERALRALRALPRIDPARIDQIVQRLHAETGAAAFDPLFDAAGREGALNEPVVDFALLRFAALPQVMDALVSRGEAGLAPMLLLTAPDPQVRAEARALVAAMVESAVPATELPDPALLRELAGRFPGEGYNRLLARYTQNGSAPLGA